MKKFIITINMIALIALVPAVIIGYLNHDTKADNRNNTEIVKDAQNAPAEGLTFRLIKTF